MGCRNESNLFVRQCTLVSPHALVLVAAHVHLEEDRVSLIFYQPVPGLGAIFFGLNIVFAR